jgi:hypothetical protein
MGLRNRMAILSETFAHDRFEKRVLSNYTLITSILEYTNQHGYEMLDLVNKADAETIAEVKDNAGNIEKGVSYVLSEEGNEIDMLIRETVVEGEGRGRKIHGTGKLMWTHDVLHRKDFDATITSKVPRGYVFSAELTGVIAKLKQHGVKLIELDKKVKIEGEEFHISKFIQSKRESYGGHKTVKLEGEFKSGKKTYPKGSIYVDMAQPLAGLIFYLLEPQADDGLVFWNYFDDFLMKNNVEKGKLSYPVFKIFKTLN